MSVLCVHSFERNCTQKKGPVRNHSYRRWGTAQEARELQQQGKQQAALEPQLAAVRGDVIAVQQDAQKLEAVTRHHKV